MNENQRLACVALLSISITGCGGIYDSTVSGTVSIDGEPLPRGTVSFSPTTSGPSAYGRIEDNGTYSVQTGREFGLPAGDYQVTVVANALPAKQGRDGGPPPMGKPITPRWYRDPQTSGLSFTVKSGSNEINIELSSEPPPGWNPPQKRRRR